MDGKPVSLLVFALINLMACVACESSPMEQGMPEGSSNQQSAKPLKLDPVFDTRKEQVSNKKLSDFNLDNLTDGEIFEYDEYWDWFKRLRSEAMSCRSLEATRLFLEYTVERNRSIEMIGGNFQSSISKLIADDPNCFFTTLTLLSEKKIHTMFKILLEDSTRYNFRKSGREFTTFDYFDHAEPKLYELWAEGKYIKYKAMYENTLSKNDENKLKEYRDSIKHRKSEELYKTDIIILSSLLRTISEKENVSAKYAKHSKPVYAITNKTINYPGIEEARKNDRLVIESNINEVIPDQLQKELENEKTNAKGDLTNLPLFDGFVIENSTENMTRLSISLPVISPDGKLAAIYVVEEREGVFWYYGAKIYLFKRWGADWLYSKTAWLAENGE